MLRRTIGAFMMATAVAVIGCGGGAPAANTGGTGGGAESGGSTEGGGEAEVTWGDMDRSQRLELMGLKVLPEMKALFQEYDSGGYGDFKCQTCHGDDFESIDFKMPNSLYGLPKDDPIAAAKDYDPEVTKFMSEKVVPTMTKLLNHEITCHSCHQEE